MATHRYRVAVQKPGRGEVFTLVKGVEIVAADKGAALRIAQKWLPKGGDVMVQNTDTKYRGDWLNFGRPEDRKATPRDRSTGKFRKRGR